MTPRYWRWIPTGLLLAILALLAWGTHGFTALPNTYYMTGPSMEPSVGQGEWFLARPLREWPAQGELVIMEHWVDDTLFDVLRRVVGLPGDTLRMSEGALWVNGHRAAWPWRVIERRAERALEGPVRGTIYNWGPVVVGPDSLFVLSDTRDMFGWPDSRFLGAIPRARVVDRYVRALWRSRAKFAGTAR